MATYKLEPTAGSGISFKVKERNIYGSSRIGVDNTEYEFIGAIPPSSNKFSRTLGNRFYEGTNHLGNVLTVVSDKKFPHDNGGTIDYWTADIVSATDYSAFGVTLNGREFFTDKYRWGFNGKEKDNEVKGSGASYDYGFRIYDTRLGRFLSVDPLYYSYPWYTPYQFAGNTPIQAIDLDGLEEKIVIQNRDKRGRITSIKIIYHKDVEGNLINQNLIAKNDGKKYSEYKVLVIDKTTDGKTTYTPSNELTPLQKKVDDKSKEKEEKRNINQLESEEFKGINLKNEDKSYSKSSKIEYEYKEGFAFYFSDESNPNNKEYIMSVVTALKSGKFTEFKIEGKLSEEIRNLLKLEGVEMSKENIMDTNSKQLPKGTSRVSLGKTNTKIKEE